MVVADERLDLLFSAIEEVKAQHAEWVQSDRPYITRGLDEAMGNLATLFAEGGIPAECRELEQLVRTLANEWKAWQADADIRGATHLPDDSVWRAWELVEQSHDKATAPPIPRIESVKTLRDQGVSDNQICLIYGWQDARGRYEAWKIDEELAHPGKHTTDWVDPVTKHRREVAEQQRQLAESIRQKRAEKVERLNAVAPESLEELVQQGVFLEQICDMKRLTEAEVVEQCQAAGLALPPRRPVASELVGRHDKPLDAAVARQLDARRRAGPQSDPGPANEPGPANDPGPASDGPPVTVEQQIVELHELGKTPKEIAEELGEVSWQKCQAVIKRYEQDPDAVAMPAGG